MRFHRGVASALAAIGLLLTVAWQPGCGAPAPVAHQTESVATTGVAAGSTEPAATLSLTGTAGTRIFTLEDLKAMKAVRGYGGFVCPPNPGITGPIEYRGVALADLFAIVGGLSDDSVVSVAATDDYIMSFTADQILEGALVTYDPTSGSETQVEQKPRPVIAYESAGQPLGDDEGPLRLVFLTPDPLQVVEGFLWVKYVARIETRSNTADWLLKLEGTAAVTLNRESFGQLLAAAGNPTEWEDIQGRTWSGLSLYVLVDLVLAGEGDRASAGDHTIDADAYTVEIVGADGHSATLESTQVASNPGYLVANEMEGIQLGDREFPLSLVGSSVADQNYLNSAKEFVAGITEIRVTAK